MPDIKQLASHIFHQTLAAIDIVETMQRKIVRSGSAIAVGDITVDLNDYSRVCAIAIGKAAVNMARGLVHVLGPGVPVQGILVAPGNALAPHGVVRGFRAIAAGHPVPDQGSFTAAREILQLLNGCDERSLVFFLLSGGGSSLVELPLDPETTVGDMQQLYRVLVNCGAPINGINSVRKHLSAVKGGRLAAAASPAMKITLAVTDVPEGCESALASGPTIPDPTTLADARAVIQRYALAPVLPAIVRAKFSAPESLSETLKPGDPAFACNYFCILLGMHDLFHHGHQAAEAFGCFTICDNTTDDWPLAEASEYLLDQVAQLRAANPGQRVAVISDGEVSSPVRGTGIGGRNSAFVLECVEKIAGKNIVVLSAGTDGQDGSSPAAGAVADGFTRERALDAGLDSRDFAARSDSYSFFRALGDTIETGPTGNNLRDMRILIAE